MEGSLAATVYAEQVRALVAEGSLAAAVSAEQVRALVAESNLSAVIFTQQFRAVGKASTQSKKTQANSSNLCANKNFRRREQPGCERDSRADSCHNRRSIALHGSNANAYQPF